MGGSNSPLKLGRLRHSHYTNPALILKQTKGCRRCFPITIYDRFANLVGQDGNDPSELLSVRFTGGTVSLTVYNPIILYNFPLKKLLFFLVFAPSRYEGLYWNLIRFEPGASPR
jgi:hypothetical protein